jgi:chemotaxis protein methyltransferase CheR
MSLTTSGDIRHIVFAPHRRESVTAVDFAPKSAQWDHRRYSEGREEDQWFIDWVMRQAGLSPGMYRPTALRRRLPALLSSLRSATLRRAKQSIQNDSRLLSVAIDSLMLGVTKFFRDTEVFATIDSRVLADLCRRRDRLRICSVGCANGAELYSVAILLAERGRLEGSCLLGIDCRQSAIDTAAAAQYPDAAIADVAPGLISRYFKRGDSSWALDDRLVSVCQWQRFNALRETDARTWDLILCRNMAMYLTVEGAASLWRRLESSLRPGGYLVVGRAERPGDAKRLVMMDACVYQKIGG